MAQGLGILPGQAMAAPSAERGLAVNGLVDSLGHVEHVRTVEWAR